MRKRRGRGDWKICFNGIRETDVPEVELDTAVNG